MSNGPFLKAGEVSHVLRSSVFKVGWALQMEMLWAVSRDSVVIRRGQVKVTCVLARDGR
jgi:hypothetical protein